MPDQSPITRPPLPDRVGRLGRARVGHLVGLEPLGPHRFPGAGLRVVAELGAQPGPPAAAGVGGAAGAGGARPDLPEPLRPGDQGARPRPQRRGQLVDAAQRPRPDARHRLLLGRVRAAPVAADLRRRPRRAGRRPLQGSERPGPAVRRHRLHVSAGLLPPERLVRRLAGRALSAPGLGRRPDRAGGHARRQAVHHRRAARPAHGARLGVARQARTHPSLPARHRPRGERALGSRAVGAPLRRRSRDPHPAGDHPGHRRRPRRARPRDSIRRCGT